MKHFKFIELILTTFSEFKSSIAIMQSGENPFGEMELSSQKRVEVTVSAENEKTTAQFPRQQVSLEWQSLFPTQTLYLSEIEAGDDYVKLTIGHTEKIYTVLKYEDFGFDGEKINTMEFETFDEFRERCNRINTERHGVTL